MYRTPNIQYPAKTEPIAVDTANAEAIARMFAGWFRETSQPRFDKKRWQFLYPSYFAPDLSLFITSFTVAPVILGTTEYRSRVSSYEQRARISGENLYPRPSTRKIS